jgi:hypothetical protein
MSKFITASFAGIIATVLVSSTVFISTPAEAAKMSNADKVALKRATVSCKAETKGKKLGWFAGRRYVKSCLVQALKNHPNIDVNQLYRNVNDLPETKIENRI